LRELNRSLVQEGRTCLVVREELGTAIIGPWLLSGRPGCHACLLARREAALHGDAARLAILRQLDGGDPPTDAGWAGGPARHFVSALVASEVAALVAGEMPQALEAILTVRLDSLETKCRSFLPSPLCEVCSQAEADSPKAGMLELRSVLKPHPRHFRASSSGPDLDLLERTYLDVDQGLLTSRWRLDVLDDSVLPAVSVTLSAPIGQQVLAGYGRAESHHTARLVAICEALERYGGLRPWGRRTQVWGSFSELEADAVDPRSFGLPSASQIQEAPKRYVPYSHDLPINWVWAFSFGQGRPVLVPEQIAYYDQITPPSERFVMETSNGCALGGTLEEAILHGILEIAERDAFLITWHARIPAPRIDLASTKDMETSLLIERFQRAHGVGVHAFNITPSEAIPCVWVMAVDESGEQHRPRVMCSAGASLDPERALRSALFELAAMMPSLCRQYEQESERERAFKMLACPDEVTTMEDHRLVNAVPEAWPRFAFLGGSEQSLQDAFSGFYKEAPEMDLTKELRGLIARYLDQGLDVIVVNQTCPEHRRTGLHCVKVLIPGTLPMTFGHANRRLSLKRLRTVPVQLGYSSRPLTDEEINCAPHPFP
jgi:ribosomal protein S12 methylthiotransferase accessory factor